MGVSLDRIGHPQRNSSVSSLYELSLTYNKNLGLLRLPLRTVSVLLGWAKILPISSDIKAILKAQDGLIRSFNSTLKVPKFFISQINFWHSCRELNNEITYEGKGFDPFSKRVSDVFYSSLGLSLSSIKFLQLLDKFKWIRLANVATHLPALLTKSSNLLTLFFVGRGLLNNAIVLNKQIKADYASGAWQSGNLSPVTIKAFMAVASKGLNFIYIATTTAALFFGVYTNPTLLMGISTVSLLFNLSGSANNYKKLLWDSNLQPARDLTTHLPA